MSNNRKNGRMVVLGALLLLAATASGCGVGLPTQPDVDSNQVQGRSAATAGTVAEAPFEVEDGMPPGSTSGDDVWGEIVVQDPSTRTGGWAKGHYKENWRHNHR